MTDENTIEQSKLALERKKIAIDYKRYLLDKKSKEIEQRRADTIHAKDIIANPLIIAITGAVLSLIASTTSAFFTSKWNTEAEERKSIHSIEIERQKASRQLQADLLKKFLEADEGKIRNNLQFLTDAGLLPDYKANIENYVKNHPTQLPQLGITQDQSIKIDPNFFIAEEISTNMDGECSGDCGNDPNRGNSTTLKDPVTGRSLDPLKIPYITLPTNTDNLRNALGKIIVIEDTKTGRRAFAVVGDISPRSKGVIKVEASPPLLSKLGISSDWRLSTPGRFAVSVLPGERMTTSIDVATIEGEGRRRFESWGGEAKLRSLFAKQADR